MKLVISSIGDKGDLKNERIGFLVKSVCNLKYFLVNSTSFTEAGFTNRSNNSYWFLPTDVEPGDKVVLYSKSGSDSIDKKEDGTKVYFRYWGLTKPIFTDASKGVVLAALDDWSSTSKIK